MKTTFKKVFEEFNDEMININENILSDVDIDVDKIKGDVFMRIKDDNSKKKISKKITILFVAILIILTGTFGVFAATNINEIFSGLLISGSELNALGLYDGGNVTVKSSDDSLDIKLLGVTGDGRSLYSAIEVRKKDGSEVVEKDYEMPFWRCEIDEKTW